MVRSPGGHRELSLSNKRAIGLVLSVWLGGMLAPTPGQAGLLYVIDQRFGAIRFSVQNLGLFQSDGHFDSFTGQLQIDPEHPEQTRIAVTVPATSVSMAWEPAADMLRSPSFFDAAAYPDISFESSSASQISPGEWRVLGLLTLHGQRHELMLQARLVEARNDESGRPVTAVFDAQGALDRNDYGITAQPLFISRIVSLSIRVRLNLVRRNDDQSKPP
jgi:polyisoprenoid-binding protein YceI